MGGKFRLFRSQNKGESEGEGKFKTTKLEA